MINLDQYVKAVWEAKTNLDKRIAMEALVDASHAKKETKILTKLKIKSLYGKKLDSFATNYAFSGEGMKVK